MKQKVSIIITTKNSAATLKSLLESIKKQSYKNIETIVVDNNSRDKTKEIAKKYTSKVFDKGPERSAQRNFGAEKSNGQYLFILDSDMVLTEDVVKDCVDLVSKDKKLGAIIVPEKSFGEGFWARAKIFEREINAGYDYFEAARFFPKNIFESVGGYDINLTGPEDWDLPKRISKKYPIGRIKSQILHNEGKHTLIGLAKKKYYYGLSVDKFLKKQQISVISRTTIYFLRPAFYKSFGTLIIHPILTCGMFIMLTAELIGGGLGYLIGKFKNV